MPGWTRGGDGSKRLWKPVAPGSRRSFPPPLLPTHNTNLQSQFPICFQRDRISKSSSSESKNLSSLSASEESAREKENTASVGCIDCSSSVRPVAGGQQSLSVKCLQVPRDSVAYLNKGSEEGWEHVAENALKRITWCTEGVLRFTDPKHSPGAVQLCCDHFVQPSCAAALY